MDAKERKEIEEQCGYEVSAGNARRVLNNLHYGELARFCTEGPVTEMQSTKVLHELAHRLELPPGSDVTVDVLVAVKAMITEKKATNGEVP